MLFINLFWSFLKIGFTSFGGATMIPLINAEMLTHGWMTKAEVADIVAIAEMTPGPLGTNCATFAGMRTAGIAGALVANLGVLMPSITLTVLVTFFLDKFKESSLVEEAMTGVRPASIGLIVSVMASMSTMNYTSWQSVVIGVIVAFLLLKFKLSVPVVMIVAAALGIILVR